MRTKIISTICILYSLLTKGKRVTNAAAAFSASITSNTIREFTKYVILNRRVFNVCLAAGNVMPICRSATESTLGKNKVITGKYEFI